MVARYLGVVEAVGSSPVTPTSIKVRKHEVYGLFFFLHFSAQNPSGHYSGHYWQNAGNQELLDVI